ncbi:MAG: hypothetical protein C0467_31315 [Planctomycetaceae bacterium]|nr:hypothetical protein [Planctomycetaceae bacterium]
MSTWADLFNSPTELEFEGKTYQLRQLNGIEEGIFQRWLEQRARDGIGRATELDDERRRHLDKDVNDAIAVGDYEFGSELCVKALQNKAGIIKAVSLILRDQGINEATAKRFVDQHQKQIAAVLVSRLTTDPFVMRAALVTLGLPEDFLRPDADSSSDSATHPLATKSGTSEASPPINSHSSSPSSEGQTATPS